MGRREGAGGGTVGALCLPQGTFQVIAFSPHGDQAVAGKVAQHLPYGLDVGIDFLVGVVVGRPESLFDFSRREPWCWLLRA